MVTASAVTALVVAAVAATPTIGSTFSGRSAHKRYAISISAECFTINCTKAAQLSINITAGTKSKPHARCRYGIYSVPTTRLKRGTFSGVGVFSSIGLRLKVSGTFTSAKRVRGAIIGNHTCGTDTYSLEAAPKKAG